MSFEAKIHNVQTKILRELLFHETARYSDIQKSTSLSSDHFNFHITRLVEHGFVEKSGRGEYKLSTKGKEYANRLDTDQNSIERQPKTAVIFGLVRDGDKETEYLLQQRRKNPYFGFWGLPSGKIRWGERIIDAARRECLEETGLDADFSLRCVYHEIVIDPKSEDVIEDKIFYVVIGENSRGKMIEDFEGGHNEWMSKSRALQQEKKYQTFEYELDLLANSSSWFNEQTVYYTSDEF